MVGKLSAAVAARQDPSLVIVGRTSAMTGNKERTVTRIKSYTATGVDAIFLAGTEKLEQLDAIHAAVKLPIMIGGVGVSASINERANHSACNTSVIPDSFYSCRL